MIIFKAGPPHLEDWCNTNLQLNSPPDWLYTSRKKGLNVEPFNKKKKLF